MIGSPSLKSRSHSPKAVRWKHFHALRHCVIRLWDMEVGREAVCVLTHMYCIFICLFIILSVWLNADCILKYGLALFVLPTFVADTRGGFVLSIFKGIGPQVSFAFHNYFLLL